MKLCVCLKQIIHTYARSGRDPESHFLSQQDRIACVDPHDEAALSLALALKGSRPETEILLLTLGPIVARDELARCLAMGADRLYQVQMGETHSAEPDAWAKSIGLAHAVRSLGGDVVLCGKESLDNCSGVVGAFMAHHLGASFVAGIVGLEAEEGAVRVRKAAGRGRRHVIEAVLPAVFSVDLSARPPACPSFADRQAARAAPIETIIVADPAATPRVCSRRIFAARPRPRPITPPGRGLAAFERVGRLLLGSRTEKKGRLVSGDAAAVEELLTFLQANDYI